MTIDKESKWTLEELIDETKEQAAFHDDMETSYYDSLYSCLLELKAYREINKAKENPTNGDMIRALFPIGNVELRGGLTRCHIADDNNCVCDFLTDWWNAPYEPFKEVEE